MVRSFVANKGEGRLLVFDGEELQRLNFSVLGKQGAEVFLGGVGGEALHVEVASLLRVLVLEGLMHELGLALFLPQGGLNVELVAVEFFSVHFYHSSFGRSRSGFAVSGVS